MAEPRDGIRAKIERADHHIVDLELERQKFLKSNPYSLSAKYNPDIRKTEYRAIICRKIWRTIPIIAGDAIHNLRSALDHLAYQLVSAAKGTLTNETGFPICGEKSPEEYETFLLRKMDGAPEEVKKHMRALHRDTGKHDLLLALHQLDIIDKHRLLPAVSHVVNGWGFDLDTAEMKAIFPGFATRTFTVPIPITESMLGFELGDIVATIPGNTESQEDIYLTFEIAFGEPEVIKGRPLVKTLREIRDLINNLGRIFIPFLGR